MADLILYYHKRGDEVERLNSNIRNVLSSILSEISEKVPDDTEGRASKVLECGFL